MRAELIVVVALAACNATQRRGEPAGPPVVPDTPVELAGEALFYEYCSQCHPGGEAGLGPAINDKPLPKLAIKTQIREGVGEMPSFGSDQLNDQQVDAIVEYLEDMRKTPERYSGR
jgi:mono/diheme cytochrome c family protein